MLPPLAQDIEDALGPMVGLVLAKVAVDLETKRIGKTRLTITAADLPVLADNLAIQLRLLVGKEIADAAAQRVRSLGRATSTPFF
jgi:hypothetical protein